LIPHTYPWSEFDIGFSGKPRLGIEKLRKELLEIIVDISKSC